MVSLKEQIVKIKIEPNDELKILMNLNDRVSKLEAEIHEIKTEIKQFCTK